MQPENAILLIGRQNMETLFHSYVCFASATYDTTPDSDDDSGEVTVPTVTLDGSFTLTEIEMIKAEFVKELQKKNIPPEDWYKKWGS